MAKPVAFAPKDSGPKSSGERCGRDRQLKALLSDFQIPENPKKRQAGEPVQPKRCLSAISRGQKVNRAIRLREPSLVPECRGEWLTDLSTGQGGPATAVHGFTGEASCFPCPQSPVSQ